MEKYFANYNQSLALNELGFDEPCLSEFWKRDDGELFPISGNELFELKYQKERTSNVDDMTFVINRPLKSQVFEWARKEHKIHCSYGTTSDSREEVNGYCISNFIDGNRNYLHIDWEIGTYEEAESACIDELIEIIKNK